MATVANSKLASIVDFWRMPAWPAEEAGYDALTLLHFGGAIGSDRIALEGFRKFVITLQLVRHEVEDKIIHAQGTLCAALELLSCEIYKVVSSGLQGWEKHIAGINAILETTNFLDEGREVMTKTFPSESHSHIAALAHAFRTVILLLAHEASTVF